MECGIHQGHDRKKPHKSIPARESHQARAQEASTAVKLVVVENKKKKKKREKKVNNSPADSDEDAAEDQLPNPEAQQQHHQQKPSHLLSRKQRKRAAAKLYAQNNELFCEQVVQVGAATDAELVAPPYVAFPIRGIPGDVVCNVLLLYLPVRDILSLSSAIIGVELLLKANDDVWETVFQNHHLATNCRERWIKLRKKHPGATYTKHCSWSYICRYVCNLVPTSEFTTFEEHRRKRRECFSSQGSEMIRMSMRQKTSEWETMEVDMYRNKTTGAEILFDIPVVKVPVPLEPWQENFLKSYPFYRFPRYCWIKRDYDSYTKTTGRRSILHKKQFECPHHAVFLDTLRHWFRCLDCQLYMHATFDRPDIWHEDDERFMIS